MALFSKSHVDFILLLHRVLKRYGRLLGRLSDLRGFFLPLFSVGRALFSCSSPLWCVPSPAHVHVRLPSPLSLSISLCFSLSFPPSEHRSTCGFCLSVSVWLGFIACGSVWGYPPPSSLFHSASPSLLISLLTPHANPTAVCVCVRQAGIKLC